MTKLFARSKPIIGVIHVGALPGTPRSSQTVAEFYDFADGFIIGSSFKVDGLWSNTVDPARVTSFMKAVQR